MLKERIVAIGIALSIGVVIDKVWDRHDRKKHDRELNKKYNKIIEKLEREEEERIREKYSMRS